MIVGGIVCVFSSLCRLSVELCACSVVYNNCRWNSERIHLFIMIFGGIAVVFSSF